MKKSYFLLVLFISLSGCGYSFLSEVNTPPVKSVWVQTFVNRTAEPDAGKIMTQLIDNRLISNKRIALQNKNMAESILSGTIDAIRTTHIAFDKNGRTARDRLLLTVSFKLISNGKVIRKGDNMIEFEDYDASGSPSEVNNNKLKAIRKAADKMAGDIINSIFINF